MPTQLSTETLFENAKKFVRSESANDIDYLIQLAIQKIDRDIWELDEFYPMAWALHPFAGLRTSAYAHISALSSADPGVFTAASADSDVTGHGFRDNSSGHQDIVFIDGIDEPEALNGRHYLLEYASATTFSLKDIDSLDAIDTSGLDAYTSGGTIYHAGIKLDTTTILANVDNKWTFGGIPTEIDAVLFDGYPATAIPEHEVLSGRMVSADGADRPRRFRYWRNVTVAGTEGHNLFWYPVSNSDYNLQFKYIKEVPTITAFNSSTYPFHPTFVHDFMWRGALANLVGEAKRMERNTDRDISTRMEVLWAQKWFNEWESAKRKIVEFSRRMGGFGGMTSFKG